jgi:glycosyltransferase involved in cell wall biosynthesis
METIYAPSQSTKDELVEKGINEKKIKVYPRGIDIEKFSPEKRNGFFTNRIKNKECIKILYVGRISKEKNLHLLASAFKQLSKSHNNIYLVIVGSGPYLSEMKRTMQGFPCLFTGYLQGDDLTGVYASSDIFVFPSTTDTFGNVVLEAQASGIPVIVTDQGGPKENIIPDNTGLVVSGNSDKALMNGLETFLKNPAMIRQMGSTAREYMEKRSFETAFIKSWHMYKEQNEPHMMRNAS